MLAKIRQGVTKRVLGELQKKADADPKDFVKFWDAFGAVLKEGLYEEPEQRDAILKLARFRSTHGEGVTLADYVGRMKEGQDAIYYLSGEDAEALKRSPHLEGFAARGVEVLLLTDPVDEFWIPSVGTYEGKGFKSVTRGAADLDKIARPEGKAEEEKDEAQAAGVDNVVALFRLTLKDAVKDVRTSQRRISEKGRGDEVSDAAWLLLDQARIVEGDPLPDPAAFSRRLADVMKKALG
jgi:molecular chaperone HtpG